MTDQISILDSNGNAEEVSYPPSGTSGDGAQQHLKMTARVQTSDGTTPVTFLTLTPTIIPTSYSAQVEVHAIRRGDTDVSAFSYLAIYSIGNESGSVDGYVAGGITGDDGTGDTITDVFDSIPQGNNVLLRVTGPTSKDVQWGMWIDIYLIKFTATEFG